jgi:hypothetical protein
MRTKILLLLALLASALTCRSQIREPHKDPLTWQPSHSISLQVGGAAYGIGPCYEFTKPLRDNFGVGLSVSLPLIHYNWGNLYSPINVSAGTTFLWGRRFWKMEMAGELNFQQARDQYSAGEIESTGVWFGALMLGLRRQIPWGGLLVRANAGIAALDIRSRNGIGPQLGPTVTLGVGYTFKNKSVAAADLPPPKEVHVGTDTAITAAPNRLVIGIAPLLAGQLQQQWDPGGNQWYGHVSFYEYTFQFQRRWAALAGLATDIGNAGAIAGLRIGLMTGIRSVRYDWQERWGGFSNGTSTSGTKSASIDLTQWQLESNVCLRLRTQTPHPWVFQMGLFGGVVKTIASNSTGISTDRNKPGIGKGFMLGASKQFKVSGLVLEPFCDARLSMSRITIGPQLKHKAINLGLMLWL